MERQRVDELLEMNMNLQMDVKRNSFSQMIQKQQSCGLQSELESDEESKEPKSPDYPGNDIVYCTKA